VIKKLDIDLNTSFQTDMLDPVCYAVIPLSAQIKTWDNLRELIIKKYEENAFFNVSLLTLRNQERLHFEILKQVRKDRTRNLCFSNTSILFLTAKEYY